MGRKKFCEDELWLEMDLANSTAGEIAEELQCDPVTVHRAANRLGITMQPATFGPAPGMDWGKAQWHLTDAEIARDTGYSKKWVHDMRARFGGAT